MKTVWKYLLRNQPLHTPFHINAPRGAKPLTAQVQGGEPVMWMLVDPDAPKEDKTFIVVFTGHPITLPGGTLGPHVGTYTLEGFLVYHVFEIVSAWY